MGSVTRRTLLETQDIKESAVSHGKILDHTLGSQEFGTCAAIIVAGTQIKDDLITEAHVLDHTLGSHNLGTTVAIIVAGTQIKDDLIGSEHIEAAGISYAAQIKDSIITGAKIVDDAIGSEHIEAAGISYAAQIKGKVVTPEKFSELYLHGTVSNVDTGGAYITYGTDFSGTPDVTISTGAGVGPGTFVYLVTKTSGSAQVKVTPSGTIVCDYIAMGAW